MYTSPSGMFLLDCSTGIWCHSFITFSFTNENKQKKYIYVLMVLKLSFQQLMNGSYVAVAFGTGAALMRRRLKTNSCKMSITPDLHIPVKLKNYHPARSRACVTFFLLANLFMLEALCRCSPFSCQEQPNVLFFHWQLTSTFDEDRVGHRTALIWRHRQHCRPSIAITNYCSHYCNYCSETAASRISNFDIAKRHIFNYFLKT